MRAQVSVDDGNGGIGYYRAEVVMAGDYYPGGMIEPGRSYNVSSYNFGYQGSLKDDEIKGGGNSYTTEFRELDPRLVQWITPDPNHNNTPWESPYMSMNGNPILNNDILGDSTNFKDAAGNVTNHVEDGSNAEFTITGSGLNQHYEFGGFNESQHGRNVVNLTTAIQGAQELNDNNPSLQPDAYTYCNYATQNLIMTIQSATTYQEGENNELPTSGMTNSMVKAFDQSPVLKKYDYQNGGIAIEEAQQGNLVLIGYYNSNLPPKDTHGHVASFAVGNYPPGTVANVGRPNGFMNLTSYYHSTTSNPVFSRKLFKHVSFYVLQNVQPKVGRPIFLNNGGLCELSQW